jgi:predicted Zn-dependent protease
VTEGIGVRVRANGAWGFAATADVSRQGAQEAHDPFAVSLEDKLELLLAAEAALRGGPRIARTEASCLSTRTATALASTDGAACTQTVVECGGGIKAWATLPPWALG